MHTKRVKTQQNYFKEREKVTKGCFAHLFSRSESENP